MVESRTEARSWSSMTEQPPITERRMVEKVGWKERWRCRGNRQNKTNRAAVTQGYGCTIISLRPLNSGGGPTARIVKNDSREYM